VMGEGKGFSRKIAFFSLGFWRESVIAVSHRGGKKYTRDRLPHRSHGRTLPETDWRDLAQLTVPDNSDRPRGNWNICLSLSPSSLSLSLYRILPSSYFITLLCFLLSFFLPPREPTSLHIPRPLSHPPAMDNSHDYSSLQNSCISNVVPPGLDPSLVDFREFYPYIPNEIKHRKRTTQAQLEVLEQTFAHDKKPNGVMRANLARQLDMTPRGVQVSSRTFTPRFTPRNPDVFITTNSQVWFQNRCARSSYPPSSSIIPHLAFLSLICAGGRKKRPWPKRLPQNSTSHSRHRPTQTPRRVLTRMARLHWRGFLQQLPTAGVPPSLLLFPLRPLTV